MYILHLAHNNVHVWSYSDFLAGLSAGSIGDFLLFILKTKTDYLNFRCQQEEKQIP